MSRISWIGLIVFLLCSNLFSGAQSFRYANNISVTSNGEVLQNPFAGGLNAIHPHWLDLNEDGQEELIVFDRSNDLTLVYTPQDGVLIIDPELPLKLPSLDNWLIIEDYDNDGRKDIFTHTSFGVRVFRNTLTNGELVWEMSVENLKSLSGENLVNMVVTESDYPAIGDFDEDGDTDVLVFDFAAGSNIVFYENISVDQNDDSMLAYNKTSDNWALIKECNCRDFVFQGELCGSNTLQKAIQHAVPKAITFLGNDLLIGIEGCSDLNYLPNLGGFTNPDFNSFDINFLDITGIGTYPVTFKDDFNGDGIDDLLVSNNDADDGYFLDYNSSIRLYEGPNYTNTIDSYLQSSMIDVGEQAYPELFDFDKDGDLDLFIGNKGELHGPDYYGTIYYYENTGSAIAPAFELVTTDFADLSQFQFVKLIPTFGDFDQDGITDLLMSAGKREELFATFYFFKGNVDGATFQEPAKWNFDYSRLDYPEIADSNQDGVLELFLCRNFGSIEKYRIEGDMNNPNLVSENNAFLNVIPDVTTANPSLAFFNLDDDNELEILKSDAEGELEIYQSEDDISPTSENWLTSNGDLLRFDFGPHSPIALGDLYGNGSIQMIVGSITGGVKIFNLTGEREEENMELIAFPNPVGVGQSLKIFSPVTQRVIIADMAGKIIYNEFTINQQSSVELPVADLLPGIYLIKGTKSSSKFLISE